MELKTFQQRIVEEANGFLEILAKSSNEIASLISKDPDSLLAKSDPAEVAWGKIKGHDVPYNKVQSQNGKPVPDVTIKVPTGGGKTLMACRLIGEIQRVYMQKLHGLVVWIVPSNQIYRQTLSALSDYDHPYRIALENSLGLQTGQINIAERESPINPGDLSGRLTIMMLMLQAANIETKSIRRMYRDDGRLASLFPGEEGLADHGELVRNASNLDTLDIGQLHRHVISSLANLFRKEKPLVIIDEGHKAYSESARKTILDFNPSFILQLSATPKKDANILSIASGIDLLKEEMIKIPIHVTAAEQNPDWQITMKHAFEERAHLETIAHKHYQKTGRYIRPICLVQVERTGKDQIKSRFIHANHVRDYLMSKCGVPEDQIAIKSSETDGIEGKDLLSKSCPIRFVITRNALQEGWDCSFAYVLAVLTNPTSNVGMTQILGRILRQPDAKFTDVPELDRCRVFSYRMRAQKLLEKIKDELEKEGLGDIGDAIVSGRPNDKDSLEKTPTLRRKRKELAGRLFLPLFATKRGKKWDILDYENDIQSNIDWRKIKAKDIAKKIELGNTKSTSDYLFGLPGQEATALDSVNVNPVYLSAEAMAHGLQTVVPNAWVAYDFADKLLAAATELHGAEMVKDNYTHLASEARRHILINAEEQCKKIFLKKINEKLIDFKLVEHISANMLGQVRPVPHKHQFQAAVGNKSTKGFLSFYDDRDFNSLETDVAYCLESQANLLWWHRMATGAGYSIQGWKPHKIYPDFLASRIVEKDKLSTVNVIETKGLHLKNEDTVYKQQMFEICNQKAPVSKGWTDLAMGFSKQQFKFHVIFEDEWQNKINEMFG